MAPSLLQDATDKVSSRQLQSSTRASALNAEMASESILRSDPREPQNQMDNSLSSESISTKSKRISPILAKALEELQAQFHGKMDRFKASQFLRDDGDFLIRLGKSMDDLLYKPVLSVKWKDRHYHFLIKELNSVFWIEKWQFLSISALLRYYLTTQKPITEHSGVILKTAIPSPKYNPAMARTQRDKRLEAEKPDAKSPPTVLKVTRSLSYVMLGENAPYILDSLFKIAIGCIAMIILYICAVY